jgi:hypothetical protein
MICTPMRLVPFGVLGGVLGHDTVLEVLLVRPRAGHAAEQRLELGLHIGPVQRAVGL